MSIGDRNPRARHLPRALVALFSAFVVGNLLILGAWLAWGRGGAGLTHARADNPYAFARARVADGYDQVLRVIAGRFVAPARPGEALAPSILFEQPWGQGTALLVLLGSGALIFWLYQREGSAPTWYRMLLASLRLTLVALAMLMLSEAVLSVERTGLPFFVILADDSASGRIVDQYASPRMADAAATLAKVAGKPEATRLAVAQGWLARDDAAFLRDLQPRHRVRLYTVSAGAVPLAEIDRADQVAPAVERLLKAEPTGTQSRLGDGVRQVLTELRGVPPTAILLLTDGQTTDGEALAPAAELARKKGVPLFTIGLGDSLPALDLELSDLLVDEVVFVDDIVRFEAKLGARGLKGQPVRVSLKELPPGSKDPALAREIQSIPLVAPPDGQPLRFEVRHRPKVTGEITYILEVPTRPRELKTDNNRLSRTVTVRQEKLKVLYIEGQPRYEYRYLKNLLERDPTIDLKVVLQSADPEYSNQDPFALAMVPTTRVGPEGLDQFDVVLFGDVDVADLSASQMNALAEFVTKKGGGLLFIAGQNFAPLKLKGTPLEPLLPIQLLDARDPVAGGGTLKSFRPTLTAEGRTSPIFRFGEDEASSLDIWNRLPELNWYVEAPRPAPLAYVLAEHPTAVGAEGKKVPILLYQYVGAGTTMFNAVDDTWRWRFRVGNKYFGRYWIQTIRFLAKSKLLGKKQAEITLDRRRYQRGQTVQIQVRFPNQGLAPRSGELTVQVQRKGQGPRSVGLKASPSAKNVFEGAYSATTEGEYEARLVPPPVLEGGLPTTTFRVDPPAGEFERVEMNEPELRRASTVTGGQFADSTATAADVLKDLPAPQKVRLDTDPPIALWNTWPMLGAFLLILTAEWVLRKRKQMV